jgi:predicted porin
MKKLLIASAALAMVAGTAQAQTSVTLYGVIDAGVANTSTNANGVKTNVSSQGSVNNATSVIGLKGSEDLGGGLKAEFQLEGHLNSNTGAVGARHDATTTTTDSSTYDSMFNRQAWVGLTDSKLGTLKFGRMSDVVDSTEGFANVSQLFDTEAASAGGIGGKNANSVRYDSPVVAGFSVAASYSNDAGGLKSKTMAEENTKNKVTTYGVNYVAGALTLGASAGTSNEEAYTKDHSVSTIYAGYKFSFADIRAQYTTDKTATSNTASTDVKTKEISATLPVAFLGKGVNATIHAEDADTTAANSGTTGDYKQYGVVVSKELSKRTALYAGYRNKNRAETATDEVVTAVGVTHKF